MLLTQWVYFFRPVYDLQQSSVAALCLLISYVLFYLTFSCTGCSSAIEKKYLIFKINVIVSFFKLDKQRFYTKSRHNLGLAWLCFLVNFLKIKFKFKNCFFKSIIIYMFTNIFAYSKFHSFLRGSNVSYNVVSDLVFPRSTFAVARHPVYM